MEKSRRSFLIKGVTGAVLMATSNIVKAGVMDMAKPKVAKAVNPFHLGMAGFIISVLKIFICLTIVRMHK